VSVENLGGRSEICQWCDIRRMQHVFVMRHISWPNEVRAGSKCAADIGNPYAAQMVYEPDDEQFDESVRTQTDMYPQQALAEQPIVDDGVGLERRRWSFSKHLLIAGLIAMLVILALLGYRR
jgi:hypothetical protein